jgi:hypothetical protein
MIKFQDGRIVKIARHFYENYKTLFSGQGIPLSRPIESKDSKRNYYFSDDVHYSFQYIHEINIKAGCYRIMEKRLFLRAQAIGEPPLWEESPGNAKRNQNLR